MEETKYKLVTFRVERPDFDRIDRLAKRLKVGRSQTIRLALDEAVAKYIEPGFRGEIVTVNKKDLDVLLTALHCRIEELESPKERSYEEAEKAARRVDELRKQGKHGEAEGIINDRAKKGLWTGYAYWPDAKEKLSPEEREKMLDERYPDRKKP